MGTNFYYKTNRKHIGKRSAAGLYCWDCNKTLCKQGIEGVRSGHSEWYDTCPECGKRPVTETMELGFNQNLPGKKQGVATCSNFTWALPPVEFGERRSNVKIINEYGDGYSKREFMDLLRECPIQCTHMIGKEFS